MNLQLIKAPGLILTRNPAELVFKIGSALKTVGGYANAVIQVDNANLPTAGQIWEIEIGDTSLSFVFNTPDGINPLLLSIPDLGQPEASITLLAQQLYRHPTIAANYTISLVGDVTADWMLRFDARQRGTAYSLGNGGATNITLLQEVYTPGVDDEYYSSLKALMRVYDTDGVQLLAELEATGLVIADSNLLTLTFHDLPPLLHNHLLADIPAEANLPHYSSVYGVFRIEVYEKREDNLIPMAVEFFGDYEAQGLPDELPAIRAGMPLGNSPALAEFIEAGYTSNTDRLFLSSQPRTAARLITYQQPEWLSLYVTGGGAYRKKFIIHYSDNTTATEYINFDVLEAWVLHIPAGAQQNNLNSYNPTKTIVWYQFSVQLAVGTAISEVVSYVIDTRYQRNSRYFTFSNSLGGVDTLRAFGVMELSRKFTRQTTENVSSSDTTTADAGLQMVFNQAEETLTLRTGYVETRAQLNYLTEMLLATEVFEVISPIQAPLDEFPIMQPLKKMLVLNDKVRYYDDADFGFAMEFQLQYAGKQQLYNSQLSALQYFYNSVLEFTVTVVAVTSTANFQILATDNDNIRVHVNGVETDFSGFSAPCTAPGMYHFKVEGYAMADFSILLDDMTGDIVFTHIASRTLNNLAITPTRYLNLTYLMQSLHRLRFLEAISLTSTQNLHDTTLCWLQRLYDRYERLSSIDLTGYPSVPGIAGVAAGNYLVAEGLTVNL
jgi:hypothetical protein